MFESVFNKTQVFSCEYYEIFKNTYFGEHLETAASDWNNTNLKQRV